jgi:enoyl-CoA hydratase
MTEVPMEYENLIVERDGFVGTVTINRPKALNALNAAVLRELLQALRELGESCRAIILTGAGEKAFVAGADIAEMAPMTPWQAREFAELGHAAAALIEDVNCATIAAINGYALGGGLELAMACDLIYAAEGAKMGQPEVNLGIVPGFGGTQRLPRLVGKVRAKELIFTGDMIDAKKACEIGLCLEAVPREALLPHCRKVAEKIASKGPLAVSRAKRLVERGYDLPLRSANRQEAETFALLFDTDDRREGMKAFVEKRAARFTGK